MPRKIIGLGQIRIEIYSYLMASISSSSTLFHFSKFGNLSESII